MKQKHEVVGITFLDLPVIFEFGPGTSRAGKCCVFRDGRYPDDPEIYCFFLGQDKCWHCRKGGRLFDDKAEAQWAAEYAEPLSLVGKTRSRK